MGGTVGRIQPLWKNSIMLLRSWIYAIASFSSLSLSIYLRYYARKGHAIFSGGVITFHVDRLDKTYLMMCADMITYQYNNGTAHVDVFVCMCIWWKYIKSAWRRDIMYVIQWKMMIHFLTLPLIHCQRAQRTKTFRLLKMYKEYWWNSWLMIIQC